MRRAPILAAYLIALCAVCASPALAAGVFSVSGVKVDVTAPQPTQARAAGFAQAQTLGYARLVKRLTLPEDLAAKGMPQLTGPALDAVVSSVQIEQERPNGNRYMAQLTVSFDPADIRKALQAQGLTIIDTRSAPVLLVAQTPAGPANLAPIWVTAWTTGGYGDELVPVSVAPPELTGGPDWAKAAGAAAGAGATTAVYANLRVGGGTAYADLTQVGANGLQRPLGTVSAPIIAGAEAAGLQALADAADAKIQDQWKRSLTANGAQRQHVVASAMYSSQTEWARLKAGLQGAARTVVSGVSIDAVSKNAALVSFNYVGGADQLAAELLRNGVAMQSSPQGVVLKLAGGA